MLFTQAKPNRAEGAVCAYAWPGFNPGTVRRLTAGSFLSANDSTPMKSPEHVSVAWVCLEGFSVGYAPGWPMSVT